MRPGQSQECRRPRAADGALRVCEVCVALEASAYDTGVLDPPRTVQVHVAQDGNETEALPYSQQVAWQNASHGTLCMNVTLAASDPPSGTETLELVLAYGEHTQDWFLPGSVRSPLLNPTEPMYPWCLDSLDCVRSSRDAGVFLLTVTEPPSGRAEFWQQEPGSRAMHSARSVAFLGDVTLVSKQIGRI
jgi:hypothetical protein